MSREPRTPHVSRADACSRAHAVVQDPAQEERDRAQMKKQWAAVGPERSNRTAGDTMLKDEYAGEGLPETCSCLYGNPCVDEYGCKDWANRFAIATKNGWKGF